MRWFGCCLAGPGAYDGRGQTRGDGSNWNAAGRDKFEAQKAEECECDFFRDTDTHTDILWHVFG